MKSRKKPMNIPKKPIILLHFERRIYGRNLKEIGQPSSAAPAWFSLTTTLKAVAIATKSHNSVEAVSKFKMAGFRLKSGFKSLKKQGLQVKKTAKKAWDSKRRHWCLFFWNYQEKKTSVRPFYRC